ncbi:MAG: alpha-2-macroglobulin family protein, partial [Acidobacteriota bacterium]
AAKRTDRRGIARFALSGDNTSYFTVARKADQITYDTQARYYPPGQSGRSTSTILYTDRSIYRPGQKILWKAVLYSGIGDESDYRTLSNSTLTVSLKDHNGETVQSGIVTTNNYGTASGEFPVPPGRALGAWRVESSRNGFRTVRVEEYKRPTFEAELLDPEEPLRLNRPAELKGKASYYFGLPVTSGNVRWSVQRNPVYPGWWWRYGHLYSPPSSSAQVIAGGISSIEADGTFSIGFLPKADERLADHKGVSYRYSVTVDITDEGGETRSAQRTFQLGFISVQASTTLNNGFFVENVPLTFDIRRTNLDHVPRVGEGIWRIVTLIEPERTLMPANQPVYVPEEFQNEDVYRTPGDLQIERWMQNYSPDTELSQWEDGDTLVSGFVFHNENGTGSVTLDGLPAGAYRLIYRTVDDFGEEYELREEFLVAGASMSLNLPAVFAPEKTSYKVGETAKLLVHSGLADQLLILEIYRGGECIRRSELNTETDASMLELPITEEDRGGIGLTLTLVHDNQFVQLQKNLMVPYDNKQLQVAFSTFRDRIRPGNHEKWSVRVTGPAGRDVAVPAAELLAYMYDRSLDAFVPHAPFNSGSLYPYRGQTVAARTNLGNANRIWLRSSGLEGGASPPVFAEDRLLYYSGYGIGGVGRRGVVGGMAGMVVEEGQEMHDFAARQAAAPLGRVDNEIMVQTKAEPLLREASASTTVPEIELRSNFSETAFWEPHLLTNEDGSVSFEFDVPDSVTAWNVWVHAVTRDLKMGSVQRQAQSVKELMVRPYLPRFLREGDRAEIKIVVNNASDRELSGRLDFDIIDPETEESLLTDFGLSKTDASGKPFTVDAGGGASLAFAIHTPSRVGQIAFKVTAVSGDFSDGELRPVPVLPGRMHLMQSRFVTLKDDDRRIIRFEDLADNDDPTRINEQMVVTLDAQLFYSVLSALPYLVDYPYECTEQTLNRFVSTGILSSLYSRYPAIEKMAREFSSRETRYEQWDATDPNRKMMLEETPWLQTARGGEQDMSGLIRVLDSRIARSQQAASIAKLRNAQTSSGGFPWFPGGPPSPYMTLYILNGFSRALEFNVDVPRDVVQNAWRYMHRHYLDEIVRDMVDHDCCWEFVTFINFALSNYPEGWYQGTFTAADRQTMLEFSFKHWREHSPLLKGYLALTLNRMDRPQEAMLVWESVMDSAKTAEDQGTFWVPEDRAWLWYNDTIETHAFAVRTEMELIPEDPKLDGLVQWLFLNKKMNHWKSTRATAEVIYSLAHYLKETGQLGIREEATVTAGNRETSFVFEPDTYTGKNNKVIIPGEAVDPKDTAEITVEKTGKGYMFASATWHFSTEQLPDQERGDYLQLSRTYFKRIHNGDAYILQPMAEGAALETGDEVEVHLSLRSKHPMEYVHLRDPRGAGFEPSSNLSRYRWDLGISWYEEIRDSGTNFFFEQLPQGEYTFKYRIRATTAGTFKVAPATAQSMYAPEFAAYSTGAELEIR